LLEVGNLYEEAVFTEMKLKAFAVMLGTETPVRLKSGELKPTSN
jgi:hypothetical protein